MVVFTCRSQADYSLFLLFRGRTPLADFINAAEAAKADVVLVQAAVSNAG